MRDSYWESMIAENPTKGRGANDLKFECPLFYMVVCSGENTMGYTHVGLGMVSGSLYYVWWFLWGFYHPFREALISLFICINSQSYLNQFAHLLFCFFVFFLFFNPHKKVVQWHQDRDPQGGLHFNFIFKSIL